MTKPPEPDPIAQVVRDIHAIGVDLQFVKVRVDRSARLDDQGREVCWFEVGYGCREIKVRTYNRDGAVGFYRADAAKVDMETVVDLLAALIDETETHCV